MRMTKKIIAFVVCTVMAVTSMVTTANVNVSADNINIDGSDQIVAHLPDGSTIVIEAEVGLPEDINQRSISVPTELYDVSSNTYKATLDEVSNIRWLYTNYYFNCSSDGKLYVKYKVSRTTDDEAKLRIGIYDITAGTSYTAFLTDELPYYYTEDPLENQMYFSGLNSSHDYAVMFCASPLYSHVAKATGTAIICQKLIA